MPCFVSHPVLLSIHGRREIPKETKSRSGKRGILVDSLFFGCIVRQASVREGCQQGRANTSPRAVYVRMYDRLLNCTMQNEHAQNGNIKCEYAARELQLVCSALEFAHFLFVVKSLGQSPILQVAVVKRIFFVSSIGWLIESPC